MKDLSPITDLDRKLAKVCLRCPVCRHARRKQRGLAFWLVKNVENKVCPFCQAYEKVYGHKSYAPQSEKGNTVS